MAYLGALHDITEMVKGSHVHCTHPTAFGFNRQLPRRKCAAREATALVCDPSLVFVRLRHPEPTTNARMPNERDYSKSSGITSWRTKSV